MLSRMRKVGGATPVWKKHGAQIFFAGDDENVFSGGERIVGEVKFGVDSGRTDVRYRITVKGIVETELPESPYGTMNPRSNVETSTFLAQTIFNGRASPSAHLDSTITIPFKFALANTSEDDIRKELPPSIDSKLSKRRKLTSAFHAHSDALYSVSYRIIATAVSDGKVIASTNREILYRPTTPLRPPIPVEDFPEEYTLRGLKSLEKSSCAISRFGVVSEEPAPLRTSAGRTQLNLLLTVFPSTTNQTALPEQCSITSNLRSSTFISPAGDRTSIPTIRSVRSGQSNVQYDKSTRQSYTMALKGWEKHSSGSSGRDNQASDEIYTASLSIPFRVEEGDMPCSTFFTPFLSRRYAVDVALTLDGDNATTLKLRLPLQILHLEHA